MHLLGACEAELGALAKESLSPDNAVVAALPLAKVDPEAVLSLDKGINPAWARKVAAFRASVVAPVFGAGKATLTEGELRTISKG